MKTMKKIIKINIILFCFLFSLALKAQGDKNLVNPGLVILTGEINADDMDSSEFVDQTVPTTMNSGQKHLVSITIKNNGSTLWIPSPFNDYKLAPYYDPTDKFSNTDWGIAPVKLYDTIAPGQTHTFDFEVIAPNPGTYNFQWGMMKGDVSFGEISKIIQVNVPGKIQEKDVNKSSFLNQSVPREMIANKEYDISISMSNTGKTIWMKDRYNLILIDPKMLPMSMNPWRVGYIELPENVQPGSTTTFNFKVTAPSESGAYHFQWSVMEDARPFGEPTQAVQISVKK